MASGLFTLKQQLGATINKSWSGYMVPSYVEYLVIAGGGGGGGNAGGGGGAGGLLTGILPVTANTSYTVTVGASGTGGTSIYGTSGGNSSFGSITATGGGSGGAFNGYPGMSGGSGGGGGTNQSGLPAPAGGQSIFGQGNTGGNGGVYAASGANVGGGGGGAGTVGLNGNGTTGVGAAGGAGIASAFSGITTAYSGGGGGGAYFAQGAGTAGAGGVGGGGNGAANPSSAGINGSVNTGGGGGGGAAGGGVGGNGGSGIIMVRYPGTSPLFGGGTISYANGYVIHTFTVSGTLTPVSMITASYLIAAGGGAGGGARAQAEGAGGGGAGGIITGTNLIIDANSSYVITVGAGGAGINNDRGTSGLNSTIAIVTTTAYGGGGGGAGSSAGIINGLSGGSGGGSCYPTYAGQGSAGTGTAGQGNNGGVANLSPNNRAGGGGGAGAAGASGTTSGSGGVGIANPIAGSTAGKYSTTYSAFYIGGGGGGGCASPGTPGLGGEGGGGAGNNAGTNGINGFDGTINSGGGGGGGGADGSRGPATGGNGGSGVVVIAYPGTSQLMSGGEVTIAGGNVIHTFKNSGILGPAISVSNSLRFRSSNSAYLGRTPTTAGSRTKWTWSAWVKRGNFSTYQMLWEAGNASNVSEGFLYFVGDGLRYFEADGSGATLLSIPSNGFFRDPSAWYHIVLAIDTTQSLATNRVKIYVNGVDLTTTGTSPAQNAQTVFNSAVAHKIGTRYGAIQYFDGYMTEINMIDGQQLGPSAFGTKNQLGQWIPIKYTGTYGTNGFYLKFSDTASTTSLGYDSSGNNNNFTASGISLTAGSTYDAMKDVPTGISATVGNYAVLNPLNASTTYVTLSDGNLTYQDTTAGGSFQGAVTTMFADSGKWYAEFTMGAAGGGPGYWGVGIASPPKTVNFYPEQTVTGYAGYTYQGSTGQKANNDTNTNYGNTYTTGDVISVAVDIDNSKVWFAKNGTWQASGDPVAGTNPAFTIQSGLPYGFACNNGASSYQVYIYANFGQRAWSYTPPTGYLALNTYNLPAPVVGSTPTTVANKYFDAQQWNPPYVGPGGAFTMVNDGQFQPDLVWWKARSRGAGHSLFDSVRGATKQLGSDSTAAEQTIGSYLTSFNTNGFSMGSGDTGTNNPSDTYIAWQWRAGGSAVTNTAGTITSSVSANTSAGFSVVTYTGVSNGTVGHGLGVAPSMIIVKSRGVQNWFIYHTSLGNTKYMTFSTDAATTNSGSWNNTSPTSSVFTSGSFFSTNSMVAYCWAEVPGFSKFGSYTGNASTDGPFVYCGFRPRWVMVKRTDYDGSGPQWNIFDAVRPNSYNDSALGNLRANASDAESSGWPIDFVSNGFKIRYAGETNYSATHIFAAFAETPFKYASAR